PVFGRGAPFGPLAVYFEAAGEVEGKPFGVFGLDADPLLARALRPLLLRDRVEDAGADPLAAARWIEVEQEDFADAGLGNATAAGADHRLVLDCHDPAVPALGRSDLAPDPFGGVVLGDHRLDAIRLLDTAVGIAPASSADSRDVFGVGCLGTADDEASHAALCLRRSAPSVGERASRLRAGTTLTRPRAALARRTARGRPRRLAGRTAFPRSGSPRPTLRPASARAGRGGRSSSRRRRRRPRGRAPRAGSPPPPCRSGTRSRPSARGGKARTGSPHAEPRRAAGASRRSSGARGSRRARRRRARPPCSAPDARRRACRLPAAARRAAATRSVPRSTPPPPHTPSPPPGAPF